LIFEPIYSAMSKHTQISLDFGSEEQAPPASAGDSGAGNDPARHYMAAAGVGVRVKSYKQTPAPGGGDLFGDMTASAAPNVEASEVVVLEVAAPEAAAELPTVPAPLPAAHGSPVMQEPAANQGPAASQQPAASQELAARQESATAFEPPAIEESLAETTAREAGHANLTSAPGAALAERLAERPADTSPEVAPLPTKKVSAKSTATRQKTLSPQTPSKRGRKSLKQVSAEADLIEIPVDEVLFRKQYYTMGEVSEMFRVNQSLLRFWESEFDILQPRKNKKGDRYFRPVDIKNLHLIYHLLRQKKYTIEGAKDFLKKNKKADERFEVIQRLQEIKSFLLEMKAQL
jgi:DNA-binding transcriptional MerR regulator